MRNHYHAPLTGVEVAVLSTENIRENSTMTRRLCVELTNIGDGLERSVYVDLAFIGVGYAAESKSTIEWVTSLWYAPSHIINM